MLGQCLLEEAMMVIMGNYSTESWIDIKNNNPEARMQNFLSLLSCFSV